MTMSTTTDATHQIKQNNRESTSAPPRSEQELIRELYGAVRRAINFYGSQNIAARALKVSSATLTRTSDPWIRDNCRTDRLPRPQDPTLFAYSKSDYAPLQDAAIAILLRRGLWWIA
jgi:hypothetical protein